MPKRSKNRPAPVPPAKLIPGTKDPILSTRPPKDENDYRLKNARAKELIMSTLIPGSEPWKIAESMENASDIWKALEARYAPNKAGDKGEFEYIKPEHGQEQHMAYADTHEVEEGAWIENDEQERRKQAQARATKEFYESMPNPDQRLLWALLHGGKPETEAWFNGTNLQT